MYSVFKYAFKYRCFFFFLFPYFNDCKSNNNVFVKKIARKVNLRSFFRETVTVGK